MTLANPVMDPEDPLTPEETLIARDWFLVGATATTIGKKYGLEAKFVYRIWERAKVRGILPRQNHHYVGEANFIPLGQPDYKLDVNSLYGYDLYLKRLQRYHRERDPKRGPNV